MLTSSVAPLAVAVLSVVVLSILWTQRARRSHLPPGPPPLPILGNLLDIPRKLCVADYQPLADKYGACILAFSPRSELKYECRRRGIP